MQFIIRIFHYPQIHPTILNPRLNLCTAFCINTCIVTNSGETHVHHLQSCIAFGFSTMLATHVLLLLVVAGCVSAQYFYYPCREIGDNTVVSCSRWGTSCPGTAICDIKFGVYCCGKTKLNCFVEPCQFAQCHNFPSALCVNEFCRGCCCEARFFLKSKEVTNFC